MYYYVIRNVVVLKMYLKYKVTQTDIDRARANSTSTSADSVDSSITGSFKEGKHIGSCGNGNKKYSDKTYTVLEKYAIPEDLILSLLID